MRFWQNRFLKGQTTSDETVLKIFITKQILLHNFALPVFFDRTFFHILFFYAYFLKHFGCIWLILLMRFWQNRFLKGQTTSDGTEIFFSLLNRYFSTTLLYQILFLMILFFKHIFLSILAEFGRFC